MLRLRIQLIATIAVVAAGAAFIITSAQRKVAQAADDQPKPPVQPAVQPAAAAAGNENGHFMFGGSISRNMVDMKSTGVSDKFGPTEEGGLLWKAELGAESYGGPIVAGGKVFVGTNNERPRNPRDAKLVMGEVEPVDKGILMCFDEKTGKFLWQAVFDKLEAGIVNDYKRMGICATPTVEGDRIYFVTNRCTVVCLDVNGRSNGVQGRAIKGVDPKTNKKIEYDSPTDADLLWEYDMRKELNVFPHNSSVCCPLIIGDMIYIVTANGVDEGHFNIPSPEAPSFIALNKKDGTLVWKKSYPGKNIMHGQWSNPTYAEINGTKQIIFPGGDGWLYSLEPATGEIIWKFDCNPKDGVYELGGTGTKNDFIATPVVYDNKVYIAVGQDPEHTDGIGRLWCIAPTKKGDISDELVAGEKKDEDGKTVIVGKSNPNSCKVWMYGGEEKRANAIRDFKFGRTMSTACIVDDILYLGELPGYIHCFNAKTGEHYWQYDTKSAMWGSCFYVDGKIMIGNDNSDVYVLKHEKKQEKIDYLDLPAADAKAARANRAKVQKQLEQKFILSKIEFDAPIRSTPVVANGVIYVLSERTLFAMKAKK